MTKIEITREELQELSDTLNDAVSEYPAVGQLIEMNALTIEIVCSDCHGTGEVSVAESDGEGHTMQGVGTQKCLCKINNENEE